MLLLYSAVPNRYWVGSIMSIADARRMSQ